MRKAAPPEDQHALASAMPLAESTQIDSPIRDGGEDNSCNCNLLQQMLLDTDSGIG
jgi:hypothetical protein